MTDNNTFHTGDANGHASNEPHNERESTTGAAQNGADDTGTSVDEERKAAYSADDQSGNEIGDEDIAPEDGPEQQVQKLRTQLSECRSQKQEYLDQLQRLQADYVNVKKQLENERASAQANARVEVLESLLPALDSFEMAFADTERWNAIDKNWRIGVENIYSQLIDALASNGIKQLNPTDGTFDPQQHESVETIATDDANADNTIARVLQTGYATADAVIRPAKVEVYQSQDGGHTSTGHENTTDTTTGS
jgi:molecular chaperone GrpE